MLLLLPVRNLVISRCSSISKLNHTTQIIPSAGNYTCRWSISKTSRQLTINTQLINATKFGMLASLPLIDFARLTKCLVHHAYAAMSTCIHTSSLSSRSAIRSAARRAARAYIKLGTGNSETGNEGIGLMHVPGWRKRSCLYCRYERRPSLPKTMIPSNDRHGSNDKGLDLSACTLMAMPGFG